jgi:hypothetical protein
MTDPIPTDHRRPVVWIDLLLTGALVFFLLTFVVSLVYAIYISAGHDLATFFYLMLRPSLHLVIAGLLLWTHRAAFAPKHRRLAGAVCLVLWVCLMFLRFGILGPAEPWESRTPLVYWILQVFIVVGIVVGLHLLRRILRLGEWSRFLLALPMALVALALLHPPYVLMANKFGLVAMVPPFNFSADYPNIPGKEGYPVCTFEHNSLGYRDVEPSPSKSMKRRVLVVGDSYVWGDGIPSNQETLPYRLRAALEKDAPGRYEVIAAAYPGAGVYGYHRTIITLQPVMDPDIVVIGFLGMADFQPYDSQARLDQMPGSRFLVNLLVNLGVVQQFHWASVIHAEKSFSVEDGPIWAGELFIRLEQHSRENGYRLLLLNYDCIPPRQSFILPNGIEVLSLPEKLKHRGGNADLWFLKEHHPKAALEVILADLLAEAILRGDDSH